MNGYLEAILQQARSSRENEPGCRRFDVFASPDDPTQFSVFEVYDDQAAFEVHRSSPHSLLCRETISELLEVRELRTWRPVSTAAPHVQQQSQQQQ